MAISPELLEILRCPQCKSKLEIDAAETRLKCLNPECSLVYPIRDEIPVMLVDEATVENRMLTFLAEHVPSKTSPMCGNSICQDRRFLARYMPRLETYFHYRNLDVSTLKELVRRWKPELAKGLTKQGKHEALADIYESIDELKYYREHFIRL